MVLFTFFVILLVEIEDLRRVEGKLYRLLYVVLFVILVIFAGVNFYWMIYSFIDVYFVWLCDVLGLKWRRALVYMMICVILW